MTTTETNRDETPLRRGVFVRVAGFAHRRGWLALILWVVILAGVWTAASVAGDDYRNSFSLPGTESQQPADLHEPGVEHRVTDMPGDVAGLPGVGQVHSPYDREGTTSSDGTTGYATVVLDIPSDDMPEADTQRILDTAELVEGEGRQVELGGDAARLLGEGGTGAAEGAGLLAALVVLALLGIFGHRFARQFTRRAQRRKAKGKADDGAGWRRLAAAVQWRPLAAPLAGTVLVGALAFAAPDVRPGFSDATDSTSRAACDRLSDGFGPGFNGPLPVVTDGGSGSAELERHG